MNPLPYRFPVLSWINISALIDLRSTLQRESYELLEIDDGNIEDADSFFQAIRDTLPLDPPLSGVVNWDAFCDSVWGGLYELGEPRVAIMWTRVERMFAHGLPDLLAVVNCFRDVAIGVNNPNYGPIIELHVFLLGEGDNFKRLEAFADI